MTRDLFVQMDRELLSRLALTGSMHDREQMVIANLRAKEAITAAENTNILPFKPKNRSTHER